jgi:hypothetical protein
MTMGDYGEHRKKLAKELKARIIAAGGEGVSVRGQRGTAWGWIGVSGSGRFSNFTPAQKRAVENVVGGKAGLNFWVGEIDDVERILGVPNYHGGGR